MTDLDYRVGLDERDFVRGERATIQSSSRLRGRLQSDFRANSQSAVAFARSVATMTRRLGVEPQLVVCGGVAKNQAVVQAVLEELNAEAAALEADPQILGAVGAALLAAEHLPGGRS